jgi:hypothetical protein
MEFKKEIEQVLNDLKTKGYTRDEIEVELDYKANYIDQALSKGGNQKFLNRLKKLNERLLKKATLPGTPPSVVEHTDPNHIALIRERNYEKLINTNSDLVNTNSELAKAVLEQQKIKSEVEKKILEISVSTEVLQVMLLNYHEFWIDQQHLPNSESLKRNLRKKVPLLLNKLKEANMLD